MLRVLGILVTLAIGVTVVVVGIEMLFSVAPEECHGEGAFWCGIPEDLDKLFAWPVILVGAAVLAGLYRYIVHGHRPHSSRPAPATPELPRARVIRR